MEKNNRNLTTKKILLAEAVVLVLLLLSGNLIDNFDYGTWVVIWIFWVLVMNIARVGYLATTPPRPHWGWYAVLLCMPLLPLAIGFLGLLMWSGKMC